MRKIYKLLVPAVVAVAMFAYCEDKIDQFKNAIEKESVEETAYIPPKSKLSLPPRM